MVLVRRRISKKRPETAADVALPSHCALSIKSRTVDKQCEPLEEAAILKKKPAAAAPVVRIKRPATAHNTKYETLQREIISLSQSSDWESAKKEWSLAHVYRSEGCPGTCLCTHHPIIEICVLENPTVGAETIVGNCCVKKFFDMDSDLIFAAVKRVKENIQKSFNQYTIDFAYERKWISDWDYTFYSETLRKQNTSDKQQEHRERINKNILAHLSRRRGLVKQTSVWNLGEDVILQARADGRIDDWEESFYLGNAGKEFVTAKQKPIKKRIEAKVAGTHKDSAISWMYDLASVEAAFRENRIDLWERTFYTDCMGKVILTSRQRCAKNRVEKKLAQQLPSEGAIHNIVRPITASSRSSAIFQALPRPAHSRSRSRSGERGGACIGLEPQDTPRRVPEPDGGPKGDCIRIQALVDRRSQCRRERDFVQADHLRDDLRRMGVRIDDSAGKWVGPNGLSGVVVGGRSGDKGRGKERRDGDWDCPHCGKLVFANKERCFSCQEPKPDDGHENDGGNYWRKERRSKHDYSDYINRRDDRHNRRSIASDGRWSGPDDYDDRRSWRRDYA